MRRLVEKYLEDVGGQVEREVEELRGEKQEGAGGTEVGEDET